VEQKMKDKYDVNMAKVHLHNKAIVPTDRALSFVRGNKTLVVAALMSFLAWQYNAAGRLSFDAMFTVFVIVLLFLCLKDFLDRKLQ
jgi:hypothetical protein